MKGKSIRKSFFLIKKKKNYLLILFLSLIVMAGIYSCNNKKPSPCTLTLAESLKVADTVLSKHFGELVKFAPYENLVELTLTKADEDILFSNNAVQIQFDWVNIGGGFWGLSAKGVDRDKIFIAGCGPRILARFGTNYISNVPRLTHDPIFLSRGQMKGLLDMQRGTTTPISTTDGKPLILSANIHSPDPTVPTDHYYLFYGSINPDNLRVQDINPSPPAIAPCRAGCDD